MDIPKLKKVVIGSTDVSNYVLNFSRVRKYTQSIAQLEITFNARLPDILSVSDELVGTTITVQRGVNFSTEENIFAGEIRNIEFDGSAFVINCRDSLYEAVRTNVTYTFDSNIDPEGGKPSEIFKSLINERTSLVADSSSVQDSGDTFILAKFVCRDVPIYERLSDLAKGMNWQFYFDPTDNKVHFEPKGFKSSTVTLEVGVNVSEVPKWTYNSDKLVNKVTVRGAEQLVETTEFFNGDGTDKQEVQLSKTPVSVKVYVGTSDYDPTGTGTRPSDNEGTLKTGGKSGSTSGDYYYTYDDDSNVRKIIFGAIGENPNGVPSANTSNIEIRYTYKLPVPVVGRNQSSIDKYGLNERTIVKSDLKNVEDAEQYMQKQLDNYSDVFATTKLKVIGESDLDVGRTYNVIDNINNVTGVYLISEHEIIYPNTMGDRVTIGDELWKTDEWDVEVWDRLKRLEEQQTESTDLLVDVRQFDNTIAYERRYSLIQIKSVAGSTGIYGHPIFGIYGTAKYGASTSSSFVLGHPVFGVLGVSALGESGESQFEEYGIVPGDNTYKELIYDDLFYDDSESSGVTWNTLTKKITIDNSTLVTKKLALGIIYNKVRVDLGLTSGTYEIQMSCDGKKSWQTVPEGIKTTLVSSDNTGVFLKIINTNVGTDVTIENTYDIYGNYLKPGITVKFEE